MPVGSASAGFLERLFRGFRHAIPAESARALSFGDSFASVAPAINPPSGRGESGPASAYCVRSCDGFHFRVRANAGASAAAMCHAFCPGSQTALYSGSDIDYATGSDGSRYADLDTAYLYRQHLVAGCTCNGRDAFGLAHVDASTDPTLRPGDVVATKDGLMAVTGVRDKVADFTPAGEFGGFSKGYRAGLAEIRIAPISQTAAKTIPAYALPENRRASK